MWRVLCIALILTTACKSGPPRKPRPQRREALSPIGGYVVKAETPRGENAQRHLVITRPDEKSEILRFPFVQQVEVVWAPDESAVAVVDALPNETRVLIFALPSGKLLREVRRDQTCILEPALPCGTDYAQVYFSHLVWLAPDRIQASVRMARPILEGAPPILASDIVIPFNLEETSP